MRNRCVISVLLSLVLCTVLIILPVGNVYAMPFKAKVDYTVSSGPHSVAVGDFNLDGNPDLAATSFGQNRVSVLLGIGNGTFNTAVNYATGKGSHFVTVGDLNRDGKPDLAIANASGKSVSILLGVGDGTFNAAVNYAVESGPWSVAIGDFNLDGNPDLAVANRSSHGYSILLGAGNGAFDPAVHYTLDPNPWSVATGDFNRDGKPDLAIGIGSLSKVSILLGLGNGAFNPAVHYHTGDFPASVAIGDFNSDGNPDLAAAIANDSYVSVLLGLGNGAFNPAVNYVTGTMPTCVAMGDFNLDGKLDLATANTNSADTSVLLGTGDGRFNAAVNYVTGLSPWSVAVGDFNRDGSPDLAIANSAGNSVSILINTPETPSITAINPAAGVQGQTLQVIINGTGFAGPVSVSFGDGVTVNSIVINSFTQIAVDISIASNASPGARDVRVATAGGAAELTGGFTVNIAPQNPLIGTGAPSSHGSVAATLSTTTPSVVLPNIQIQSANLSAVTVTPGTPVTVTADISNKSTVNGIKKVTLYVNGQVETTQAVTVNSGSSSKLAFNISRSEPGDYSVYVDGVPAGSFKVEMVTDNDCLLMFSVVMVAFALIVGMIMLWRRQRRYN